MTAPVVQLRRTGPEDFDALRRLFDHPAFAGWGGPSRLADDQLRAKYLGSRYPAVECFLVLVDQEAVGLAQLHTADEVAGGAVDLPDGTAGESGGLDLILLPWVRGRGVGRAVVVELVRRAQRERGWRRITVDPDLGNRAGIRFWQAVGFRPEQTIGNDPGREPYVVMVWGGIVRGSDG
jgi:RimJ/RimL family protein N-acetyltransferase